MSGTVSVATPTWPPVPGAYDYILTLNDEEIAWEGLRRNPDYQRDFGVSGPHHGKVRHLPSGQSVWRIQEPCPAASRWGLHPFCRSGAADAGGSHPLAHRSRHRRARCRREAGWLRLGQMSGKEYVSLSISAPELGSKTLYANLGRAAGESDPNVYALIWNPRE